MKPRHLPLRIFLAAFGLVIFWLGLDIAFGGIRTLGWMGPTDFLDVADPGPFNVQDNHVRFLGGVWCAIGLAYVLGAALFARMKTTLLVLCGLIFVGGLSRFTGPEFTTLFNFSVLPSFLIELIGMPLLAFWIFRSSTAETIPVQQ